MITRTYFRGIEYHSNEVVGQTMQAEILKAPVIIEMTESQSAENTDFRIYGLTGKFIKKEFSFERRQYQNNEWESLMYYSSIPEVTQDFDEFINLRKFYAPTTTFLLPNQPYECTGFFNHAKEFTSINFKIYNGSRRLLIEIRNNDLPMDIKIDCIVMANELLKRLCNNEKVEIAVLKNLFAGSDFSFTKTNVYSALDLSNALLCHYFLENNEFSEDFHAKFIKVTEGNFFELANTHLLKGVIFENCLSRLKFSIDEYYSTEEEL